MGAALDFAASLVPDSARTELARTELLDASTTPFGALTIASEIPVAVPTETAIATHRAGNASRDSENGE
jgi:hypothetical protein